MSGCKQRLASCLTLGVVASACGTPPPVVVSLSARSPTDAAVSGDLARGLAPDEQQARRPRYSSLPSSPTQGQEASGAPIWHKLDDRTRLGLSSSALRVRLLIEPAPSKLVLKLWPVRQGLRVSPTAERALGLHVELEGSRLRVQSINPADAPSPWREKAVGVERKDEHLELRVGMAALSPLPALRVDTLRYAVSIDGRSQQQGQLTLNPPLVVPDGVQRRAALRVCMIAEKDALVSYDNGGWRCAPIESILDEDGQPGVRLGHTRLPEPPRLQYLKERMIFVNLVEMGRGVAALLDPKETVLSYLRLGIVGARQPGNDRTKYSDAEALTLPDGDWAVAVTHALRAKPDDVLPGGRCSSGHRVFLSFIAVRSPRKTGDAAQAAAVTRPAYLEEVGRVLLEDCEREISEDWELSTDRTTITLHSSLYPTQPSRVLRYCRGRYRPEAECGSRSVKPGARSARR